MAGRRSFGTVRKLRSGRWQALYTHPHTRRRVTGATSFPRKADATAWLATVETDLMRGDDIDPSGRGERFGTYAEKWLAGKVDLRPRTQELYEYLLRVHLLPTFESSPLQRIDAASIREWNARLRAGRISGTTAAKAYRLMRQILQAAVDDRLIRTNPCQLKGAATERSPERKIPSLEEVADLADAIEPRYRAMVLLAAHAGLRKGECFGLARRHLSLDTEPATVTVERSRVETQEHGLVFQEPKTIAGHRTLALPSTLAAELEEHLDRNVDDEPDALLFTSEGTSDTPTKTIWRRIWGKARSATGVSCTFHDLRHVAGTLNAAAGATTKEAMARLGHASPEAALRYQHAAAERDTEIANRVDTLLNGA